MLAVGFSGDLCISGSYLANFRLNKEIFSTDLLNDIKQCDYFVSNFEGAETDNINFLRSDVRVVNPKGSLTYLSSRNINIYNPYYSYLI